jgi:orotidine-5'-phosphate decarboxylase
VSTANNLNARASLALALDVSLPEAVRLYERVEPWVGVVKVGLSLFVEHGPSAVRQFSERGARVFLDLKLHDIPNTVELASAAAASLGISYLTVHAGGGAPMLRAAVKGAQAGARHAGVEPPIVFAVTVLTSMDDETLRSVGIRETPLQHVERLATMAHTAGARGIVCSAREVAQVRRAVGPSMILCTPGIRPAGSQVDDQARVETPSSAISAGANLLVIGRPITQAADPVGAAAALHEELRAVLAHLNASRPDTERI